MAGIEGQVQQPEEVKVDPTYEFEAPRYMEFGLPEETVGVVDEWFGELNIRPFYTPAYILNRK